jgi:hypothetical protein
LGGVGVNSAGAYQDRDFVVGYNGVATLHTQPAQHRYTYKQRPAHSPYRYILYSPCLSDPAADNEARHATHKCRCFQFFTIIGTNTRKHTPEWCGWHLVFLTAVQLASMHAPTMLTVFSPNTALQLTQHYSCRSCREMLLQFETKSLLFFPNRHQNTDAEPCRVAQCGRYLQLLTAFIQTQLTSINTPQHAYKSSLSNLLSDRLSQSLAKTATDRQPPLRPASGKCPARQIESYTAPDNQSNESTSLPSQRIPHHLTMSDSTR